MKRVRRRFAVVAGLLVILGVVVFSSSVSAQLCSGRCQANGFCGFSAFFHTYCVELQGLCADYACQGLAPGGLQQPVAKQPPRSSTATAQSGPPKPISVVQLRART